MKRVDAFARVPGYPLKIPVHRAIGCLYETLYGVPVGIPGKDLEITSCFEEKNGFINPVREEADDL